MKFTKYSGHIKIAYFKLVALIFIISLFLMPSYQKVESSGNNVFDISLNGTFVGTVSDESEAERLLWEARREVAQEMDALFFAKSELATTGREAYFECFTERKEILDTMKNVLTQDRVVTRQPAFTIKVNQLMISVSSIDEVRAVLQAALDKYQTAQEFVVALGPDKEREINVLTAVAESKEEKKQETELEKEAELEAGVAAQLTKMLSGIEAAKEQTFDDFDYGVTSIAYEDKIEIVESYLPKNEITPLEEAISLVTELQDVQKIYEVQAGDTLSEISLSNDIPLETIIALNDSLEDENSTIQIGEELIITSPEPELSVVWQEEVYVEEDYEAEIQYIDNDEWYTTDKVVRQQPSAGHHKIAAVKTYHNEKEIGAEVLKEEVTIAAVPKIVERGTKIPPTYIKPLSGGRLSSQFGRRKAPTRGASTYHKGVDWATPIGTTIVASSAGKVIKAGWGSGYGYVVYLQHADGRQTRYAHLSKVLVKSGQTVAQGQRIALSGNTGRSTGPHLHFEMLIGGSHVNPLKYLN